jgi:hypothetical protein
LVIVAIPQFSQKPSGSQGSRRNPFAISLAAGLVAAFLLSALPLPAIAQQEESVDADSPVGQTAELAPFMGELQRLTHKLSLSIAQANFELARFYLYESLESMNEMKRRVSVYRGFPIALLIEQISTPKYKILESALRSDRPSGVTEAAAAMNEVIGSCNQCHQATGYGFIKIKNQGHNNPFNQDFAP